MPPGNRCRLHFVAGNHLVVHFGEPGPGFCIEHAGLLFRRKLVVALKGEDTRLKRFADFVAEMLQPPSGLLVFVVAFVKVEKQGRFVRENVERLVYLLPLSPPDGDLIRDDDVLFGEDAVGVGTALAYFDRADVEPVGCQLNSVFFAIEQADAQGLGKVFGKVDRTPGAATPRPSRRAPTPRRRGWGS